MEPIFDRNGKTVGWLHEDVVYDLDGANLAFVFRGALFGFDGTYALASIQSDRQIPS